MVERILRGMAGSFTLIGLALAYFLDLRWLLLVAFVGLNLLQSAFTNWCPAITLLKKMGVN